MSHYKQKTVISFFSVPKLERCLEVFKTTRIYKETQKLCENMSFDLIKMDDWNLTKNMSYGLPVHIIFSVI